ncbi:MAG: NAD-binding protein [Halodesulfurarchaeum sp.]
MRPKIRLRDTISFDPDRLAPRVAFVLTLSVAILSIVTGVANISAQSVVGPLAEFIPPTIQRTAGFTGVLTGFLMITSALGLRRGLRAAWVSTLVLLPLTTLQGLLQSSPLSAPLVILSLLALPSVLLNRSRFTHEVSLSTSQLAALIAVLGVLGYGTVGTYALRAEFAAVDTLLDAFYYTLVTASTVGYGDAVATSQSARLFGMTVVVFGTASFALALGTLLGPLLEARFARALGRMTDRNYDLLQDHVLILGWGELTEAIIEEIEPGAEFVLVTEQQDSLARLADRDIDVLSGNPSDEAPLKRAGIEHARTVLVATDEDGDDALAVLTARELNPAVRIVAAATNRENVQKLRRAGADTVISPTALGARMLVDASFGEEND